MIEKIPDELDLRLEDFATVLRRFRNFIFNHETNPRIRDLAGNKIQEMLDEIDRVRGLPRFIEKDGS